MQPRDTLARPGGAHALTAGRGALIGRDGPGVPPRGTARDGGEENAMLRDMLKREVFERDAINNELRAECERLRQQLNSANQQQQPLKAI